MRPAATAPRHGTAVSRGSRAVMVLLGATAAAWCASVLLAAPAEASDGLDLGGLGDTVAAVPGGLAEAVGPARPAADAAAPTRPRPRATDAVRPVVEQVVEPVVRHTVRPVVRRVEPAAKPVARSAAAPAPAPTAVETALPRTRAALGDATEQLSGLSKQLGPVRPRTADAPRASAAPTLPVAVVGTVGAAATAEVPALLEDVVEQVLAPVRDLTTGVLATLPGTVHALDATVSSLLPTPTVLDEVRPLAGPVPAPDAAPVAAASPVDAADHRALAGAAATSTAAPDQAGVAPRDAAPAAAPDASGAPVPPTPYDGSLPGGAGSSSAGAGVPVLVPACRLDAWVLAMTTADSVVRDRRTPLTSRPSGRPDCTPD